ncbi:hypothetical protein OCU04_011582 [Sclerotinia nivalis]|uniref:Uncharacterized protein n=1 Tax=Sclerotinia nivalis TaxID=352851 RepID=A0A9X0AC04_9HELO|nr:hypothetical protein OCU04_011582 [Sclerotinia nivalis]
MMQPDRFTCIWVKRRGNKIAFEDKLFFYLIWMNKRPHPILPILKVLWILKRGKARTGSRILSSQNASDFEEIPSSPSRYKHNVPAELINIFGQGNASIAFEHEIDATRRSI